MMTILEHLLKDGGWEKGTKSYVYWPKPHGWIVLTGESGGLPTKYNAPCRLQFFAPDGTIAVELQCGDVRTAMDVVVGAVIHPSPNST